MLLRRAMLTLFVAAVAVGCSDQAPTTVQPDSDAAFARGGKGAAKRAAPLTNIPVSEGTFAGTVSITHIGIDPVTRQLLFSGTVTRTSDGLTETFTGVPGTLGGSTGALQQFGASEAGVCDILFLDLGPINLDLLGLVLDISPIQIDLDADPGAGNLLGNLLCAVTGLLDAGGLIADIVGLLDRINGILDLLNNL